jgi:RNA polymerase sigma-70 factor, ECF subfamily
VDPDERKIVEAARRGDADAFRELVLKFQRRAYAVALGMVHDPDDAKDICQDAFLKVHKSIASFAGDAQFFTWLYRIVVNLCIDHLRKRRGADVQLDETRAEDEADDDSGLLPRRLGFDPERALADQELRGHILGALGRLSAQHRAVLILREIEGLSYQEIADQLRCSIGTVMSRLFHARKNMQKMLLERTA